MGFLSSLFGGGNSSASTSSSSRVDERNLSVSPALDVSGESQGFNLVLTESDNASIALTDWGAIRSAENITLTALDNIAEQSEIAAQTTQQAVDKTLAVAQLSAQSETEKVLGQAIQYGAVVLGIYFISQWGSKK